MRLAGSKLLPDRLDLSVWSAVLHIYGQRIGWSDITDEEIGVIIVNVTL